MGSFLQYPDAINPAEMQIWNNAAFDNGESEDSREVNRSSSSSWWSQSLESSCSKENLSPVFENSPVPAPAPLKSSVSSLPFKPLQSRNNLAGDLQVTPMRIVLKQDLGPRKVVTEEEKARDERKIDLEIEEIEKEIKRLSSRLEALRLEKAEKSLKVLEKRGRVVPAKFMEQQKQTVKVDDPVVSKVNRRGVSLGPAEIVSGTKTRFSLGKPEMITPVSTQNNRRKSCFWKLGEIDELKVTKERGKSLSVSPKSRKTASKVPPPKQAVTTVGSKRAVKKDDGFLALIQPKTLFKYGEKSATNKKPMKPGRVVASRYNQIPANQSTGNLSEARKRSLPDNDKEEGSKRRASRGNGMSQRMESTRVKKKWDIPSEVVVYRSDESLQESPQSVSVMAGELPKIRTNRCVAETPRDSGAAKRVADLVGRKTFFSIGEDAAEVAGASVCLALSFAEEEEEEEDLQEE
ncbi:hypothetical protein Tsubulata_022809 [Turnera subulata]|uniref:Uncharacterized protein n=1 Tax=Turnera subulata TaxID=218843 RepID=A0A9Q0IX67_9ROSI|nr:hypothetical protein Tsubulata_022809 [Turnera subulata]